MADIGKVDYHVHYHVDSCVQNEMTLDNIERAAMKMGLEEIAVVKHYSYAFPNGEKDWVAWHTIKKDEFESFLEDVRTYRTHAKINILAGVETELVDEYGQINMDDEAIKKIDSIALSVHYMPAFDKIKTPFLYHPRMQKKLLSEDEEAKREFARWHKLVNDLTPLYFVEKLFGGYEKAIRRYPKITQLAHMFDGLFPLRDYQVPYEQIGESQIIEIMEPMMKLMAEKGVLWEILNEPVGNERILKRAAELGVRFVASADGHSLNGEWGRFVDHPLAENYIDALGLPKGVRKG